MSRSCSILSLVLLVVTIGACSVGRRPASAPAETPPAVPTSPEIRVVESAPPPEPVVEVPAEPVPAAGCVEADRLARRGEHKPAVEALDAALAAGGSCAADIVALVAESNRTLRAADELIRRGLAARDVGDLASARRDFAEARSLYPRYYWIDSLEDELDAREQATAAPPPPPEAVVGREVERLRNEGDRLRAEGKLTEALVTLETAATLGSPSTDLQEKIEQLRSELATAFLAGAQRAQKIGDERRAVELTLDALDLDPPAPVRGALIDFARRLGLNLFSDGQLLRARDIWRAGLALDAGNELLIQYLEEVEARLRSLEAIKKSGS